MIDIRFLIEKIKEEKINISITAYNFSLNYDMTCHFWSLNRGGRLDTAYAVFINFVFLFTVWYTMNKI